MELPNKIFAMIPTDYLIEAAECPLEFTASVTIGRCPNKSMAMIVTVKSELGRPVNGIQFVADLSELQDGESVSLADKGSGKP